MKKQDLPRGWRKGSPGSSPLVRNNSGISFLSLNNAKSPSQENFWSSEDEEKKQSKDEKAEPESDYNFWNIGDEYQSSSSELSDIKEIRSRRNTMADFVLPRLNLTTSEEELVSGSLPQRSLSLLFQDICSYDREEDVNLHIYEQLISLFRTKNIPDISIKYINIASNITLKLAELFDWLETLTIIPKQKSSDLIAELKSGVLLCKLVNTLRPGTITSIRTDEPFGIIENISSFLRVCMNEFKLLVTFSESDLIEERNRLQVINSLYELARKAPQINPLVIPLASKPANFAYPEGLLEIAVDYAISHSYYSLSPRY